MAVERAGDVAEREPLEELREPAQLLADIEEVASRAPAGPWRWHLGRLFQLRETRSILVAGAGRSAGPSPGRTFGELVTRSSDGHGLEKLEAASDLGRYLQAVDGSTVLWLVREAQQQRTWLDDLLAGKYINCVYCGHRYGPEDEVPASRAEVLTRHVEQCPRHPLAAARRRIAELEEEVRSLRARLAEEPVA